MNAPDNPDPLSRALADWRVQPPRNPQFRASVQARLAPERRAPSWSGYVRAHSAWVATALAVAVLAGGWTGRARARATLAAESVAMAGHYVRGLDARVMRAQ
ncbi:MAG: hypothetical protein JNL39_02610 [Opitutaceae bacterium]|nr:hypothetical protein [Opitutaceae bacterium]